MTDIKEPINTTSDGTFLSVVCEKTPKSVVGQKFGGLCPPPPPQELPPWVKEIILEEDIQALYWMDFSKCLLRVPH